MCCDLVSIRPVPTCNELNVECKVGCCSSHKCNGAPERAPTESPGGALGDSQVDLRESPSGTLMGSRRTSFRKSLESYGLQDSTNCYLHCQPYVLVQMLTKLRLRSGEKIPPGYHDQN